MWLVTLCVDTSIFIEEKIYIYDKLQEIFPDHGWTMHNTDEDAWSRLAGWSLDGDDNCWAWCEEHNRQGPDEELLIDVTWLKNC